MLRAGREARENRKAGTGRRANLELAAERLDALAHAKNAEAQRFRRRIGTASVILQALGYDVKSDLLGIEVIYQSLKENELDAFLGYWDPAMQTYAAPYEADGSIERLGVNLAEAKYVPAFGKRTANSPRALVYTLKPRSGRVPCGYTDTSAPAMPPSAGSITVPRISNV